MCYHLKLIVTVLKYLMVPCSQWYQIRPLVFQPRCKIILYNDFHVSVRVIINHYIFSKKGQGECVVLLMVHFAGSFLGILCVCE